VTPETPAAQPIVGVLALQGDVREHVVALAEAGAGTVEVRRPEQLDGLDGLVIPGGESTTIGRLLTMFDLIEPLRQQVRDGLPVFGSCAGMVLLAGTVLDGKAGQTLVGGLDIVVRRNAFGRQVDSFETSIEFAGVSGGPVHGVFIRAPWVETVGPDVEVLARVPDGPAAGAAGGKVVAVRQGSILATSFHPELSGDPRVHALFVSMVRASIQGWEIRNGQTSAEAVAREVTSA
jgi:5'-phosphate synthase pdxT subunit